MTDPKPTILVVDDEEDIREILSFDLRRKGFDICYAENGNDAFRLVLEKAPHIVISDIRMPGGGGLEFLRNVRKRNSRLPHVILTTGYADITLEEAIDEGAEALFTKPFDRKNLMLCIEELCIPEEQRWARRRAPRTRSDIDVNVTFEAGATEKNTQMLNLGRGGFFLAFDEETLPRIGDTIAFRIRLEELSGPIEGFGVVRWVRKEAYDGLRRGCGIQFSELTTSSRTQLIELLNGLKTHSIIPRT